MTQTSPSLLQRLRTPEDSASWARFSDLYVPLLYYWARQLGVRGTDTAADLVQDVLVVLVRELPHFAYDPSRSFRAWLRRVLVNRWRTLCRRPVMASLSADPVVEDDLLDDMEESEYRRHLVERTLRHLGSEFSDTFRKAFERHVLK